MLSDSSVHPREVSSPAAYPHLTSNALDDLQYDYTTILHQTFSHPSLHPSNLGILPHKKSWLLNLDLVILSDSGNALDALFMVARAALWDSKVPVTRPVQYAAKSAASARSAANLMDTSQDGTERSGFDTRRIPNATDFELPDYWDEGETLAGREFWPVCVTLNVVGIPPPLRNVLFISVFSAPACPFPGRDTIRRGFHTVTPTIGFFVPPEWTE